MRAVKIFKRPILLTGRIEAKKAAEARQELSKHDQMVRSAEEDLGHLTWDIEAIGIKA